MSDFFEVRADSPSLRAATKAFVETFLSEVLDDLKLAARGCGYALAVHGSKARDIDIIAVPWTSAADTAELLVERLCGALAGKLGRALYRSSDWCVKPHGRRATTIILPGLAPEIDLSVMPRIEQEAEE